MPKTPGQALFTSDPESVAAARRFADEVLAQDAPDLDTGKVDDIRLIVSELVTNSIRHGAEPGGSVLVAIESTAENIRIEVHDPVRRRPRFIEPDERGGRGLFIVQALAETWGVTDRDFGKAVWAVVAR
ncbi:ATP-binding protein [Streptomyces sp. NPDC059568]|uniref:ATP-binding protein n=1 Tax=unclassified Streptomyces TaxID=2593676 RepID=UPI003662F584